MNILDKLYELDKVAFMSELGPGIYQKSEDNMTLTVIIDENHMIVDCYDQDSQYYHIQIYDREGCMIHEQYFYSSGR